MSWSALALALALGGLDPPPDHTPVLQAASMAALLAALVSLGCAVIGLARGSQRLAATLGLGLSLLFLVYFTGVGFVLVR